MGLRITDESRAEANGLGELGDRLKSVIGAGAGAVRSAAGMTLGAALRELSEVMASARERLRQSDRFSAVSGVSAKEYEELRSQYMATVADDREETRDAYVRAMFVIAAAEAIDEFGVAPIAEFMGRVQGKIAGSVPAISAQATATGGHVFEVRPEPVTPIQDQLRQVALVGEGEG